MMICFKAVHQVVQAVVRDGATLILTAPLKKICMQT
jgi:hypothetical protein